MEVLQKVNRTLNPYLYSLSEIFSVRYSSISRSFCARIFRSSDGLVYCFDKQGYIGPVSFSFKDIPSGSWICATGKFNSGKDFLVEDIISFTPTTLQEDVFFEEAQKSLREHGSFQKCVYQRHLKSSAISKKETLTQIIKETRSFFAEKGFLEVFPPQIVRSGGFERYLKPFEVSYEGWYKDNGVFELPTSPEISLKKILVQGQEKIFSLGSVFRNEGQLSPLHEPDFLMLEWYEVASSLEDCMQVTQQLLHRLSLFGKKRFPQDIPCYRMADLFQKFLQLSIDDFYKTDKLYAAAHPFSVSVNKEDDWDTLYFKVVMEVIEPFLKKQNVCFVTDFPAHQTVLAQKTDDGKFARRFECYINGIEICNGYQELCNKDEFIAALKEAKKTNPNIKEDPDFVQNLGLGLPFCSGNALGVERLAMVLLECDSLQELKWLPFQNVTL